MPPTEKQVRVFISSTFRDMHAERDHLITVVFPELRERVERLGLEFFDVDLRWGVPEQNADGEKANAWAYCRQWIERVEPLFVCILGQRYGWIPEAKDFKDNSDQARQAALPRSITDIEVRYAVLNDHRKPRSYFYMRETPVPSPPANATIEQLKLYDEFVDAPKQLARLGALKAEIRQCGRPVRNYKCRWTGQGFDDLDAFGRCVLADLWSGVLRDARYVSQEVWRLALGADPSADSRYTDESQPMPQELCEKIVALARPVPVSPLDTERQQMKAFAESRLKGFQGRAAELSQLTAFLRSSGEGTPRLAVVAALPGQGKSALLAKLSTLLDQSSTVLITHFVGAAECSSSALHLVKRLLDELDRSGIKWPDGGIDDDPQCDMESLRKRLAERLGQYAGERRIVLLIDALNQLSDGHDLLWLPRQYGPCVRIVVSCVNDSSASGGSPEQRVMNAFATRSSEALPIALGPLTPEDVQTVVVEYLEEYCKELDSAYVKVLGSLPQASNPLYLLVTLGELRTLGGNDMNRIVPALIASFPQHFSDTVSLFVWVLQRLEVFGTERVKYWCTYLAMGRVGMGSCELAALLKRKLGEEAAGRALLIERGLRRYLQRRGGQLDFFHDQLRRAVMRKYGTDSGTRREATLSIDSLHNEIAQYFTASARGDIHAKPWETEAVRGFSECVYHFMQARDYDKARTLLVDFAFLQHKIRVGLLESVLDDFDVFCGTAPAVDVDKLGLHASFFREKAHILRRGNAKWPAYKIFLQLAIEHADDSPLTLGAEQWLADGHCDWTWLRRYRRRPHAQVSPCRAVLEGHAKWIEGTLVLPDGRILSWSEDETLRIWDSGSGKCLCVLEWDSAQWIEGALPLRDGRLLAWAKDATLRIWDSRSGECLAILKGHTGWVKGALILPDGRILSWAKDGTLRIWNSQSGECTGLLEGHSGEVRGALVMPDGRILSWAKDRGPRIWDNRSGECLVIMGGHLGNVTGTLILPDGGVLSWAGGYEAPDCNLRISDSQSGKCRAVLVGHFRSIRGALVLPDTRILSWSEDNTLRIWDSSSGECQAVLKGHSESVCGALVFRDERILSWAGDTTLRIWESRSGECQATLEGHSGWVSGACALPDGHILSWAGGYESTEHTLRIWNSVSGKCVAVLEGHSEWVNGALVLPSGQILSWAVDRTLRIWDGRPKDCLAVPEQESGEIAGVLLLPDGRVLSWAEGYKARDNHLRIWDSRSGSCIVTLEGHTRAVAGALVLPDGRILSWARDTHLRIWDSRSGKCCAILKGHSKDVAGALVLSAGRIISWADDALLHIWDSESGTCMGVLEGHSGWINGVLALPGGRILSWAVDKTLRIWESQSGKCLVLLEGHSERVNGALILPNSHILSWASAAKSTDCGLRLWDSRSGECFAILKGHLKEVNGARMLADGRILSWARDASLRIWDSQSGACLAVLEGHSESVRDTLLLADGRILSWAKEESLRVWNSQGRQLAAYSIDDALKQFPEFRVAYGGNDNVQPYCLWSQAGNAGHLRSFGDRCENNYWWHGISACTARYLLPDGRMLLSQDNGQACFLQLYRGNRPISIEEQKQEVDESSSSDRCR